MATTSNVLCYTTSIEIITACNVLLYCCCSCLKAIRRLQRFGHLPNDDAVFKSYAIEGNFSDVRQAALEALVDFTAGKFICGTAFVLMVHCNISVVIAVEALVRFTASKLR